MKYWFKARTYGWGWAPTSPEGWFVTISFILTVVLLTTLIKKSIYLYFFFLFVLAAIFFFILYKTGKKPK